MPAPAPEAEGLTMAQLEEIESGASCTHKNTGLRYQVIEAGEEEVLLSPMAEGMEDLVVPTELFLKEFAVGDRYSAPRGRGRGGARPRRAGPTTMPSGPRVKGRIKKMVRERGFGFIRGDDGKEVFFHRSGLNTSDYDSLSEGDVVEYVIQEGPRGARAENVRAVAESAA
jgi:CspA family cold shock protein